MKDSFWKKSLILWAATTLVSWFVFAAYAHVDDGFTHDFELITCDAFLADASCQCLEKLNGNYTPKEFIGPVMVLGVDFMYRVGEDHARNWNEFLTCDIPGIALGTLINVRF